MICIGSGLDDGDDFNFDDVDFGDDAWDVDGSGFDAFRGQNRGSNSNNGDNEGGGSSTWRGGGNYSTGGGNSWRGGGSSSNASSSGYSSQSQSSASQHNNVSILIDHYGNISHLKLLTIRQTHH